MCLCRNQPALLTTSPAPKIIFRYRDGHYHLASDLMKKPAPPREELKKFAQEIRQLFDRAQKKPEEADLILTRWNPNYPVPQLWSKMLDLIYAGNETEAMTLFNEAWPDTYPDKQKALKRFNALTPGNIAYYAIQHAKSGRRAYGQSKTDPLHPCTQLNGRASLNQFEDAVKTEEGSDEPLLLTEVFSNEQEDPSTKAARNLDWQTFSASLNDRCQAILHVLAEGGQLKELAKTLKVSTSTINNNKNQLKLKLLEFFGSDILKEISHMPQWRTNLLAHREMLACREERMPA